MTAMITVTIIYQLTTGSAEHQFFNSIVLPCTEKEQANIWTRGSTATERACIKHLSIANLKRHFETV